MSKIIPLVNMPLRDLLNQLEHRVRELQEHMIGDLSKSIDHLHSSSRPKRRKSAYPSLRNVSNSFEKYCHDLRYAEKLSDGIDEGLRALESRVEDVQ